jgi:20S proteasome alpha/beta subunit
LTLVNSVYVPTGIVLSGDSRTSGGNFIVSDSTNKVFLLFGRFGLATAGGAYINNLPIEHYVKEFEMNQKADDFTTIEMFAEKIRLYFKSLVADGVVIMFIVAGYDETRPCIYGIQTVTDTIDRVNEDDDGNVAYGIYRNGDIEIVNRLFSQPENNPLFNLMNLQDAIDFSRHLIRTTIDQLRFEPRFPTVGGAIDTLLIEPNGNSRFIMKKILTYSQ